MKFTVTIDATPEEMRTFFGWPEVAPLQQEMLDGIREQLKAGESGFDPMTLMQPYLAPNMRNVEAFQKAFWQSFANVSQEKSPKE
ncbi:MAG TPA: DUF6489 family protein [Gammaproteobacteria bacterium]